MKKNVFSFGWLMAALLFACFTANAQISYTINTGNVPNLMSNITGVLTPIPQGVFSITNGNNIAMPWVAPGGPTNTGYTFAVNTGALPAGATNFLWSAAGDLEVVPPATGSSVTIRHRNLTVRGTPDSGQSKGRITFSYASPAVPCTTLVLIPGNITFDVFKQFAGTNLNGTTTNIAVPPIVGPNCILPNKQYTYSVDPVVSDNINSQIGIDRYLWDVSQALTGVGAGIDYYSTDSSSITFTTGNTVPANCTLICKLGQVNFQPLQTTATLQAVAMKSLQASAGVPVVTLSGAATGVITAGTPFCINTNGSTVTPLTFTATAQPGVTYSWIFGTVGSFGSGTINNWNTSPAQPGVAPYTLAGNTLTIANIFNQPGAVTLVVTDACGTITNYQYYINRRLTAADASLVSISSTCLTPASNATVTLSNSPANQANLNTLVWTPVSGWNLTPSGINPTGSVAPGSYSLNASFNGCATPTVPYVIRVRPAAVTISPVCFPRNTAGNAVTASPAGTSYTWSTSSGSISGTTQSASLTTLNVSPFTISATYTVATGCSTTGSTTAYLAPIVPTYTLPSCIGSGVPNGTTTINITNYPGWGNYTLTYVSGANVVASASSTGAVVNVILTGTAGSGVYTLRHNNASCTSAGVNITLTANAPTFTTSLLATTPTFAVIGTNINTLAYQWFNCTTNTLLGATPVGTTTWNLNVPSVGANNDFGAQATVGGCVYRVCVNVPGFAARQSSGNGDNTSVNELPAYTGRIFPNPNRGEFTIELSKVKTEAHTAIYDMTGKAVYKSSLHEGINKVNNLDVPAGNYIVTLLIDGTYYTKNIVVSK